MKPAQERGERNFCVTVPPIACSFPWKMHPEALKLKELSDAWVEERFKNLPAACKGQQAAFSFSPASLLSQAAPLIMTVFYPKAKSAHILLPLVKLVSWTMMLDDFLDDRSKIGGDCASAERLIDSVVAVLQGGQDAANATSTCNHQTETQRTAPLEPMALAYHPLIDSAREWWEELQVIMSPSQQARFTTLYSAYLNATCSQLPFCAGLEVPDLETYLRLRPNTISCYPLLLLIEPCLSIELDPEALTHPLLINLRRIVCEHVFLVNDISSFGREYTQGDFFNMVFLVCFRELGLHKLPDQNWQALLPRELLQDGVIKVSEMIRDKDVECVRIMEEIRGSPVLMSKVGMEKYLEGLGHVVAGSVYWHCVAKRYRGMCVPTIADGHPDLHASFQVHLEES